MENIYTVAKPFLTIFTFFGAFQFSFEGSAVKGKFVFKFRNLIPAVITLSLLCYYIVTSCLWKEMEVPSKILSKALKALIITDFVFIFVLHIYQLSKSQRVEDFLLLIYSYDNQVSYFSWTSAFLNDFLPNSIQVFLPKITKNWRYQKRWLVFVLASSTAFLVIMHAIYPIYALLAGFSVSSVLMWSRFFYIDLYRMIHVVQFSLASLALHYRFKTLNDDLKTSRSHPKIETVKFYNKLCDGIEILNETLTFHFIFNFISITVDFFFAGNQNANYLYFFLVVKYIFIIWNRLWICKESWIFIRITNYE